MIGLDGDWVTRQNSGIGGDLVDDKDTVSFLHIGIGTNNGALARHPGAKIIIKVDERVVAVNQLLNLLALKHTQQKIQFSRQLSTLMGRPQKCDANN